ncbi:MAG TPA: gliding motility-associated ABC transporter ATP-binding subunit GldA [Bacteroidales bacterium]|nr:gliding motility-associated ABC transporter ATP-binding subunit GldA [Bacteroidales bacterium]HRX95430.1 gliding motility-associated ABC transporter ATP-binding subunit GldA [Bacteroidales bacterium]
MSITVENITKLYGQQRALDDVSFKISGGEVVGLLGPNGAGKSTMMKILTCFIPPSSGKAYVYGHDIFEESLEVRKKVGYLPENNPLYLDLYVKEYLEFVGGIYRIGNLQRRINEMIEITGLGVEQKKKIGALSKGYRQRVGLAQALIHDPEVLILDEPTSGLDPNQLVGIRNLIKKIGKEKTVMLSTHIMQEVEAVCDRAIIINKGKIVADDSTEGLSARVAGQHRLRVEFNKEPDLALLKAVDGVKDIAAISDLVYEINSAQQDVREQIFQFAVKNNLVVLSMQQAGKGIEEVFQQLTGDNQ